MPRPFDDLNERLLRSGVAHRHARRYVRELEEHLSDLIAVQKARGFDEEDSALRARALLGCDEELAEAMIARRQFRSLACRAPWLVFALAPPLVILAAMLVLVAVMVAASGLQDAMSQPVGLFRFGAAAFCGFANFALGPLCAVLFITLALRQRLDSVWPKIGILVIAVFAACTTLSVRFPLPHVPKSGAISIGIGMANSLPDWQHSLRFGLTAIAALISYATLKLHRSNS